MLDQLRTAMADIEYEIDVLDIDIAGNEALLERYDELVPVLTGSVGGSAAKQLCHYFLDLPALNIFLSSAVEG